jgi:hypothetical protein
MSMPLTDSYKLPSNSLAEQMDKIVQSAVNQALKKCNLCNGNTQA